MEQGCRRISIVGGGGKTTLLYMLADWFQKIGLRTVVMTTVKIYQPDGYCRSAEDCEACWERGSYAVCGTPTAQRKLTVPAPELMSWIEAHAEMILAEADGARGMACKVPAAHEPVLLSGSDLVIGVMGLDVIGKTIQEACFRPADVAEFLQCEQTHVLEEADLFRILCSDRGTAKQVGKTPYLIVLNKCEGEERRRTGQKLQRMLEQAGYTAVLASLGGKENDEQTKTDSGKRRR